MQRYPLFNPFSICHLLYLLGAVCVLLLQPLVTLASSPGSGTNIEQDFTLFSKDRRPSQKKSAVTNTKKQVKAEPKKKTTTFLEKKYSLRGTSLLGTKKYAILQEVGKSELFSVRLVSGSSTPLPEDPRYQLEEVSPRQVKLRYPLAAPCKQDDPSKGIECVEKGKYALLSLIRVAASGSNGKNKTSVQEKKSQGNIIGSFPSSTKKTAVKKRNPFINPVPLTEEQKKKRLEKLQKDPGYQKRKEQYKNFKVRRIKKDDVPPGMKVQQTPFGDVLVPVK